MDSETRKEYFLIVFFFKKLNLYSILICLHCIHTTAPTLSVFFIRLSICFTFFKLRHKSHGKELWKMHSRQESIECIFENAIRGKQDRKFQILTKQIFEDTWEQRGTN